MKVFIGAVGSGGDVNPMLTLGAELQRRGHDCTLLAGEWQAPAARALGLGFHPILSSGQFERFTANVAAADSPGTAWITFFYDAVFPAIAPAVEHVCERASAADTWLIGASHVIGLRLAAERLGLPHVTTLVQPEPVRPSADDPFSVYFNGLFGRRLDQQRRAIGLTASPIPFMQWLDTRRCTAALFPQWFAVPGIDATRDERTVVLDFLLDDPNATACTSLAIDAFLATYEAPLVFTFGTGSRHVRQIFELAVSSALALGRPAILLTDRRAHV